MSSEPLVSLEEFIEPARPAQRRSHQATVRWGSREVTIGGGAPVACSR